MAQSIPKVFPRAPYSSLPLILHDARRPIPAPSPRRALEGCLSVSQGSQSRSKLRRLRRRRESARGRDRGSTCVSQSQRIGLLQAFSSSILRFFSGYAERSMTRLASPNYDTFTTSNPQPTRGYTEGAATLA